MSNQPPDFEPGACPECGKPLPADRVLRCADCFALSAGYGPRSISAVPPSGDNDRINHRGEVVIRGRVQRHPGAE